jgi:(2Fe-2S) ferredoxin
MTDSADQQAALEAARAKAQLRGVGGYGRHMLLCIGPDCCSAEAGEAAWAQLKRRAAEINGSSDTASKVYRTKVGCLRVCEAGPVAVVYPEGTWYGCLDAANLERVIASHLESGEPVPELMIGENRLG